MTLIKYFADKDETEREARERKRDDRARKIAEGIVKGAGAKPEEDPVDDADETPPEVPVKKPEPKTEPPKADPPKTDPPKTESQG